MNPSKPIRLSPLGFGLLLTVLLTVGLALFHRDFYRAIEKPDLMISELMALNHSTIMDADGDYPDWIEIYNPKSEAQSLEGWFLTDDFRELRTVSSQ